VPELQRRSNAAMNAMTTLGQGPTVNTSWLLGNGYCFGGLVVFELARMNFPGLKAVSGFHPSLAAVTNSSAAIQSTVAAHRESLRTVDDPDWLTFQTEMTRRRARWTAIKYANVSHGWTDPRSTIYKSFEAAESHARMRADYLLLLQSAGGPLPYAFPPAADSSLTSREKGLIAGTVIFGALTVVLAARMWRQASHAGEIDKEPLVNAA